MRFIFKFHSTLAIMLFYVLNTCNAFKEILNLNRKTSYVFCAPPIRSYNFERPGVYYIQDKNSVFLKECLLRNRSVRYSVTLMDYEDLFIPPDENELTTMENGDIYPDYTIFMPELREDFVKRRVYAFVNSPHFVIIYLITTTKNTSYACDEHGVFQKDIFKTIENYLNRFWQKYEMFHMVVEFPFVCPGWYIIFYGKKPSGMRLYGRKIISVSARNPERVLAMLLESREELPKNYPVRANLFERFPTSMHNCTNIHNYLTFEDEKLMQGYCGMDVFLMHDILRHFQFNVDFPPVDNSLEFGYYNKSSGCATGSLGYLQSDIIDISFNSRFMVKYLDNDHIQFMNYISTDEVCAVMRRPSKIPLWHYPFSLFRFSIWVSLAITFGIAGLADKFFNAFRKRVMNKETDTHSIFSFLTLGFFGCNFTKKLPVSILGGTILLTSITMLALYQSNVNYMYTTLLKYDKIKTLAELTESKAQIYTSMSMLDILGTKASPQFVFKSLKKLLDKCFSSFSPIIFYCCLLLDMLGSKNKSQPVIKSVTRRTLLSRDDIAFIHRKADMLLDIIINYSDEDGRPLLYIVKECYSNFFLSYIARKDFPFIPEINIYLMHLIEAGLPDAYYRMTQNSLRLVARPIKRHTDPRPFLPSTLEEQRVAFCLLLAGYAFTSAILVVEMWWAKRTKLR